LGYSRISTAWPGFAGLFSLETTMKQYSLYYLNRPKPVLSVVPDAAYTGMWRVAWPDGRLSDMVNLTRAKDAGLGFASRQIHPDTSRFKWKADKSRSGASPVRQNESWVSVVALAA
jgi:hypothetical protein